MLKMYHLSSWGDSLGEKQGNKQGQSWHVTNKRGVWVSYIACMEWDMHVWNTQLNISLTT